MIDYKTISFRVDNNTYNYLQECAKEQYLSLSAFIRKSLDSQLDQEVRNIELFNTNTNNVK